MGPGPDRMMTATPFASHVDRYISAGWVGVLPLPAKAKKSPPTGFTGANGAYATVTDIDEWRTHQGTGNIGLRMAPDVIGIDVDNYGTKTGGATLDDLRNQLGELPDTCISTSRLDGVSGIRFYRLTEPVKLVGSLPGIEIIQRHHRYAVVAPSIHPEGRPYMWLRDGEVVDVPNVDDLPELPAAWVEHLRADRRSGVERHAMATGTEVSPAVEKAFGRAAMGMSAGTRHDTTLRSLTTLLRFERQEHPGATRAIFDLERLFIGAVTADGTRSDREAQGEWDRMVESANDEVATTPSIIPKWEPALERPDADALGLTAISNTPTMDPDAPWVEPIPLGGETALPPFPVHVLPPWVTDYCDEVADDLQVPIDLPAMLALGALSTLTAGHLKVNVRGRWSEHTNLYLVVAMPPSTGKSPAYKAICGPVNELEREHQRMIRAEVSANADVVDTIEAELKRTKQMADVTRETLEEIRVRLHDAQDKMTTLPKFTVGDATPEALAKIMSENQGRMAVHSTEGGVFDLMTGRYGDRANLEIYLQGWSADRLDTVRVGRDANQADEALLTMVLTVQPSVIAALADKPELAGRGLTARFMYSVPPDVLGHRDMSLRPVADPGVRRRYETTLLDLGRRMLSWDLPAVLTVAPDGAQHYTDWRQGLEARRVRSGDLRPMAEWTGKLEASVLRVAAILHIASGSDVAAPVTAGTIAQAISVGEYWLAHAKFVHDMWGTSPAIADARFILEWAAGRADDDPRFTVRDLYKSNRARFKTADATLGGLLMLAERGWVRTEDGGPVATQRGKKSVTLVLHPEFSTVSARSARSVLRDQIRDLSLSVEADTGGGMAAQNAQNAQNDARPPSVSAPTEREDAPGTDWMEL